MFTWQVTTDRRVSVARECSSLDKISNAGRTLFTPEAYRSVPILNGIEVVRQPEVIEENFSEWDLDFSL